MKVRKFELKELAGKNGNPFKYQDVLELIVKSPTGQQGIMIDEMRKLIKILDKIDEADGFAYFTNEEWELVRRRTKKFPFGMVSHEIISFCDDLDAAQEVELTEA